MLSFREFVREYGLLYFVISAMYVAVILLYSFQYGRLAGLPQYDDVAYFMDAIKRYHILIRSGLGSFVVNFYDAPPLSPVISIMAVLSYVFFGIQDWAPYLMNGVFVFFVLTLVAWYFQKDAIIKNLMIIFLLTCPLLAWGVHDFRPDVWNGLFTSLASFMVVKAILDGDLNKVQYSLAGILLGGALLVKPSASLFTIGIYTSGIIISIMLLSFLEKRWCFSSVKKVLYSVLVAIILISPYYLFAWHMIYNYVYAALITDKEIWAVAGDMWFHMTFYLTGNGGGIMLGAHYWIVLAFSIPLLWLLRGDQRALVQVMALIVLTILSWFVVSVNVVKTHFLGASFYWFLLLTFAVVIHHVSKLGNNLFTRKLLVGALCLVAMYGVITFKQSRNWWIDSPINVEQRNEIISNIVRNLEQAYIVKKTSLQVFMPYTGYLAVDNLSYLLFQQGQENIHVTSYWLNYHENIPNIYNEKFSNTDVVITASENKRSIMTASQGVAGKHKEEINQLLFSRNDFFLYRSYLAPSGQKIFIYVKKEISLPSI